jgi:hypothetical protein
VLVAALAVFIGDRVGKVDWEVADISRLQAARRSPKVAHPNAAALILRKSRRLNFVIGDSIFPDRH